MTAAVLGEIRSAKSHAKLGMRARVASCIVIAPAETITLIEAARVDLVEAGGVDELTLEVGADESLTVKVEMGPGPP
jgi:valyl-tRNA synthetase